MTLTAMDWFCGAGGSSQALDAIPGVSVDWAANHWEQAIASHAANFPGTDHWIGDIRDEPVGGWPIADIFWASPECPQWSAARGKKQSYQHSLQEELFDADPRGKAKREEEERSRALMEEVPLYLEGVIARGGRVLVGVVENVVEVRKWDQWDRWINRIRRLGYHTRVIALNSMHAQPARTPAAPQSRDRLYVAYWHESLRREPDWDKWLRPMAFCEACDEWVQAVQVFKKLGADIGRYRQQYTYRCPRVKCRNSIIEPPAVPAAAAIDWSLPGTRIGDRDTPLADKTMQRIRVGLRRYAVDTALMVPAGGTWRDDATPVTAPMAARTTRENDGVAIPAPVVAGLRAGHGLVTPPAGMPPEMWRSMLLPYYGKTRPRPVAEPIGTLPSRDHYALVDVIGEDQINDVRFRMLEPHEIGRAMAFGEGYVVLGSKRDRVRQYGNAVTPPCAEIIVSALVEAITGDQIERWPGPDQPQLGATA